MRVAFVVPSLGPTEGQGNVNFELLRRVAASGHEVTVVSSLVPDRVRALDVTVHQVPRTSVQLVNQRLMIAASTKLLKSRAFDVVHADGPITRAPVDVAVCHMPHAAWTRLPKEASRERGARALLARASSRSNVPLEQRIYTGARRVLVASDVAAAVLKDSGVDPARIVHLPFGVDASRLRPPSGDERRIARHRFGIEHDEFCVLFVGSQGPRKGLPALLAAMDPRDHLLAVGDRRGAGEERAAHGRGLRATFTGKIEDVRAAYWAADVLVAPSRFDAFGMAIVEALSCGLPVVTSKASGAWVRVGEAGIVLDEPTDASGIATAISVLRSDPLLRARMGAIGRAAASAWTWDSAGDVLLRTYDSVASEKGIDSRTITIDEATDQAVAR
jgi:glycosyltransferase involved in cell wall biosynthesis